jgi:Flp pilus assembly protein TadG
MKMNAVSALQAFWGNLPMNTTGLRAPAARHGRKRRFGRLFRRLAGCERGVALVEFAIVAIPFFLIVFGTFEIGFIYWGTDELENATEDAARRIRTGQVQAGNVNANAFKAIVCNNITLLRDCTTKLQLDVRTLANYDQIGDAPEPLDGNGNFNGGNFVWQPGGPRSIVLVRTYYEWPLLTVLTSASLGNMSNGNRLLSAASAFRNEAWPN